MGRWRITIDGVGAHHNGRREIDADLAAKDLVKELRLQGHNIEAARFEARGAMVGDDEKKTYDPDAIDTASPMNIDLLAATAPAPANTGGSIREIPAEEIAQAGSAG